MKNKFRMFGEFTKVEPQPDGTVIVGGIASSETPDSDGEVFTKEALVGAIPDYMRFGAVREMHGDGVAAGTAIDMRVQDDGKTYFECLVVDPSAVKKVETRTYKGFSIGGTIPLGGRDPMNRKVVRRLNLKEVSLVDRPANPDAVFTFVKIDKDDQPDEVRKGMYQVSVAAELLNNLSNLQSWPGKASPRGTTRRSLTSSSKSSTTWQTSSRR